MAQTYEEARDALSEFATTEWEAAVAGVVPGAPLHYTNINADPPEEPQLWGRLHIQNRRGTRASLGSNCPRRRRFGTLFIMIFVPIGVGTQEADQVADSLVVAFEDAGAIDNIWFRDVGYRDVGPDGTYHQVNFEAQFTFDRTT